MDAKHTPGVRVVSLHDPKSAAPPREVWVVSSPTGADFVSNYRQGAMEHAAELAGEFPESGPYRVCRYVAEPFAAIEKASK